MRRFIITYTNENASMYEGIEAEQGIIEKTIEISALEKTGIEELYNSMVELFRINEINPENTSIITNVRHKEAICSAENSIKKVEKTIKEIAK